MRKDGTRSEAVVWRDVLSRKQMMGYRFLRQRPMDRYIVDFFSKELQLIIELDGYTHQFEEVAKKDRIREERLRSLGYHILRFEDEEVIASNNPLEILSGRVAGVVIQGSGPNTTVSIRNAQTGAGAALEPLILVDDVPTDVGAITSFPANLIQRVEIFKGPSTAAFGVRGAGGVIAFYTKNGAGAFQNNKPTGVIKTRLQNSYHQPRVFYAPKYAVQKPEHIKPDSRIVLHWEPMIILDENGQATIEFWNSDEATEVLLDLQGITQGGKPMATTITYKMQK